jgi:hypothetical protein
MRKTETVTIDFGERDRGKVFWLTEMPASQAEKWAARALSAAARSGVDLPPNVVELGFAGVVVVGIRALMAMNFADYEPLMDEMFNSCVAFVPDPKNMDVRRGGGAGIVGPMVEDDIEDVATRVFLRERVFSLHVGFSLADGIRDLISKIRSAEPTSNSLGPRTSRRRSRR